MPPTKSLDLLIDQFIENDIRAWVESKQREAEQTDFWEEEPRDGEPSSHSF